MALYSVWDHTRNEYRVYATQRPVSVGDDPLPPRPSRTSVLGADPDQDVKPLPSGTKFMGYSHVARGEIRRLSSGFGDLGDDAGAGSTVTSNRWFMLGLGVAAGGLGMHLWMRRKK